MASNYAVGIAGFVHLILGISFYLKPPHDSCSPAPVLGSLIFSAAVLLLAKDLKMYPDRYLHLPYAIQFIVETIGSLAVLEFFALVVWCMLERLIHHVIRFACLSLGMADRTYLAMEYWILAIPTIAMGGTFLFLMKMAVLPHWAIPFLEIEQTNVHMDREVYGQLRAQQERSRNYYRRSLRTK